MAWKDVRLPKPVYVRKDRSGAFHTYPELDGPFQNFDALQSALHTHARGSSIDTSKETLKECVIRESLFWSDGTRIVSTSLEVAEREATDVRRLVEALLDKQNDDEDLKYELKDIVHWQSICEGAHEWYYHLNITVKTKGADDDAGSANLLFAEVTFDQNDMPGCFLSCFCKVNADGKDEVLCHGCMNNGSTDMKHPPTNYYNGGHADIVFPLGFGPCNEKQLCDPHTKQDNDEEEQLREEEEERIKESLDYLDDMEFLEEVCQKRAKLRLALNSKIQEDGEMACKD